MASTNSIAVELQTVTAEELSAAFRAAKMRRVRPGYGLLTALNTPCVERAMRLYALAMRKQPTEKEAA